MAENREVLLKQDERVYYDEKCPGCKIDKLKQSNPNIPFKHLFYVFIVALVADLPIATLFPFMYFMVRDFHIAKREEDIGYYAGAIGASFMCGRFLTSLFWGVIADRYGRKPVIIFGTIAVLIFNTLFGLSTSFWMAVSMRFLQGCLCGNLGAVKAYASEICRKEYQALGMSIPAEKFPDVFSKESLFGRFPYFLPCLFISIIALVITILCFWLPETLHFHSKNDEEENEKLCDRLEASKYGSDPNSNSQECEQDCQTPQQSLYKNWPLMSSIIVYCVFQLHDMAYAEIFPLWAVSPKKLGGLSYSSSEVGEALSISGMGMLLFQLFVYPPLERRIGLLQLTRIGAVVTIALLSTYPFMANLSGLTLTLLIDYASVMKNIVSVSIATGLFLLQNRAVSQKQRGAANGISMAGMSLFKGAGPAGGGSLFSWAMSRQHASFLPGVHMVFFILNVIEFIALMMTFKPFLDVPK
ncbi:probable peptide/nitrate transporter At3g43790 isoform X2 [Humulus lupulus]|uniref:probable peptide/nitrate transporter At3g43790 isoform X2 n=1 Tax=Humulus lupulus TaxID=3486 RepID=UPI002B40D556|nr:probable peptide/nitrate transporter At3g43790 isoform X2 [Humulus lupulus]